MMPEYVQCESQKVHMAHNYSAIVQRYCSGYTSCGLYQHQPHHVDHEELVRCPGICDCGDSMRGKHGPGEHK